MFELDSDCSRKREQLELLWQKDEPQTSKTKTSKSGFRKLTSKFGLVFASFSLAMVTALAVTVTGVDLKPNVNSHPQPIPRSQSANFVSSLVSSKPAIGVNKSTITGIVDSKTLTASQYWTMILRSDSGVKNEAEFDLALPEGSALSRVTLWVNGIAQEAAFNATDKVRAAYSQVVRKARDPVLVTWKSKDRIHIKVFPISSSKDFKFRVGMTTPIKLDQDRKMKLTVPYVVGSKLRFDTVQDLHFESDVPLSTNRSDVNIESSGKGYLLRANIPVERLMSLSLEGIRGTQVDKYVTRLTHSSPSAFALSRLKQTATGQEVVFEKSLEIPFGFKQVKSEEAAYRVSSLWANQEIQKLIESGDRSQAVSLAMAYRIVSPVSGATVLESDRDYKNFGLHRDMYRTSNYSSKRKSVRASILQGATNGTIGPQGGDATAIVGVNSPGTVRVNNLATLDSWVSYGGPVAKWLVASPRDANLYDIGYSANTFAPGPDILVMPIIIVAMLVIPAFTFLGATTLFCLAIKHRNKSSMRNTLLVCSLLWMILGLVSPTMSQLLLAFAAFAMLHQGVRRFVFN